MGNVDVQDEAHAIRGKPVREVDVAHLPTGGPMLRNLGPGAADLQLMEGCHAASFNTTVVRGSCKALVS
eukprot:757623-Hanusia_phi.AAC.7